MLVIGAKGFAKQILEVFTQLNRTEELVFYDDVSKDLPSMLFGKFRIIRSIDEAGSYFQSVSNEYVLGIGSPELRRSMASRFTAAGGNMVRVISPFARISNYNCNIEKGTAVLTNCIIESDVRIGEGSLVNINSSITHDTMIGKFCEISPGVQISGGCNIGDMVFIGTGAVLLPKVSIASNVVIGAGAVVTKDVGIGQTVVGVPAKPVRK